MKKALLSFLVVFATVAIFALEPVYNVSGTAGFELMIDEQGLDISPVLTDDSYITIDFLVKPFEGLTASFTFNPLAPGVTLNNIEYEEEAWLVRFEPNVIGLSTYTINADYTAAVSALKLSLKDFGVNLVLADLAAGDVTPHATGDFAFPEGWILGASYDLDVSGVTGLVAGAYKFEATDNTRLSVEGKLTEVPVPGELTADAVFGMLNVSDDSSTAYRINASYKYPFEMDPVTVTPHVGFTWQENLNFVFAAEKAVAVAAGKSFSVADTQSVTAGADVKYAADPLTVELTDTLTINLLDDVYSLDLTPTVEYALTDSSLVGVSVPVSIKDLTDAATTLYITPHGYITYVLEDYSVTIDGDVYFFFEKGEVAENSIAYLTTLSYAVNDYMKAGFHAGNETLDADGNVDGADTLADLHWYLFFKTEFEF
jgi:hypothetical protein